MHGCNAQNSFALPNGSSLAIFASTIMEINDCEIAFHILTHPSSEFIALSVILADE